MDAFYALAEPRRRRVLELLASRGKMSASQISGEFEVSPQAVSQHLNVLREADLISMERQGQRRIYAINPESMMGVKEWAEKVTSMWSRRFDALGEALESEKKARTKKRGAG
ncbi:MAG: winged helix-turn-helix transcriptional regulator [Nitrososphaerota archaeon]|nr:winged helix-turn-helix transcriptional regulator [Nitrososphaerota archaeon]